MTVAKVSEITSTSSKSFEDAIDRGIKRANKTLKNVTSAWIADQEVEIEKGRVYIFALRDIKVGEELAYDYAYERSGDETQKEEKLYACRCGAPRCRGTMVAPRKK